MHILQKRPALNKYDPLFRREDSVLTGSVAVDLAVSGLKNAYPFRC